MPIPKSTSKFLVLIFFFFFFCYASKRFKKGKYLSGLQKVFPDFKKPLTRSVSTRTVFSSRQALLGWWSGLPSFLKNQLDRTDLRCQLKRHCLNEDEF